MRCGFCNLFTTVDPAAHFMADYLEALERQAQSVQGAVGELRVVRMALGGGTPTFLATADLARLFAIAERLFGVQPGSIPTSVETSPLTATPEKLRLLRAYGVDRISIGVQSFVEAEALRKALPAQVYLWINAYKRLPDYYTPDEMRRLSEIDPLFPLNTRHYASQGHPCHAGRSVISVDGDGVVRRCHFIKAPIGNIYDADFEQCLSERLCTNTTCHCHIGYVHMPELRLDEVFGDGILERIPARHIW